MLQEVLLEWVEAMHLLQPIERLGAWLTRVAHNRIVDRFRTARRHVSTTEPAGIVDGWPVSLEDRLPARDAGPDAAFARAVLIDELAAALDELPDDQRFVFVAHAIEGRSFKDLAGETGESVNTLLSRKHYAVRRLRRRLDAIHDWLVTDARR
ncbi:MAG: sigma-70 family RNA polymerase sigma factor [Vicinamibacterales bacterium]